MTYQIVERLRRSSHSTEHEAAAIIEELAAALEIAHAYMRQTGWHLALASEEVDKDFAEKLVAAEERAREAMRKLKGE